MGKVKRILASRTVEPEQIFCGVELCETVHIHLGSGVRLEFDVNQFAVLAETFYKAFKKWIFLEKPEAAVFTVLAGEYLPGQSVYATRFEIEEQTVPSVHLHLRALNLRFSMEQFLEFADVIAEAKHNLTG